MLKVRHNEQRGHANHGWLDARHSFSFANYYDPAHMHFRHLRVINEDRIAPDGGFPMHSHQDMEIVTYIIEGALEHKDDMGNGEVLRPGEIQRMSAGHGITHSEFNPSSTEPAHLLQIWILTEQKGIEPGYEQLAYRQRRRPNELCLMVTRGGGEGIAHINQDMSLYSAVLESGKAIDYEIAPGRHCWLQLVRGSLDINGTAVNTGDGLAVSDERYLSIRADDDSEFLLFDLA